MKRRFFVDTGLEYPRPRASLATAIRGDVLLPYVSLLAAEAASTAPTKLESERDFTSAISTDLFHNLRKSSFLSLVEECRCDALVLIDACRQQLTSLDTVIFTCLDMHDAATFDTGNPPLGDACG